jgi:putative ABC transport system substrate-binding protein
MKRRTFITLLGGAAAWPFAARAQQHTKKRIGVLTNLAAEDREGRARIEALLQGLSELGWQEGRTLEIDIRWGADDAEKSRTQTGELLALAPDVIFATTTSKVQVLRRATRTLPIVFAGVSDPVGGGLVETLAHPGGNITGFALLVSDADEIEAILRTFSGGPNGGLIVTTGTVLQANRKLIIALAARYGLPAVYPFRLYVNDGGLLFYGADIIDLFRRAASYVDRILKGEKAADLPVQAPTKYELVLNMKTAKALGLELPATLLARADEVIE